MLELVDIGHYISAQRIARKISMRKLAELARLSHTEIYRLENGERKHPSPCVLKAIALALDLSYNELMKVAGYLEDSSPNAEFSQHIDCGDLSKDEIEEVERFIEYLRYKRTKAQQDIV
nr:helix-turn-helix transcriptional regulator [Desulfitobacterium sp. PCE1]